jgi:hypothetical protein
MAYIRQSSDLEVIPKMNILDDLDIQILDIKRMGSPLPYTRLVNLYNGTKRDESQSIDTLLNMTLDPQIATVITGDWNTHHPRFAAMKNDVNPSQRAERTAEWVEMHGFELLNDYGQITWSEVRDGRLLESSLDFTFQNAAAACTHNLRDWKIDDELNADSDHFATTFTIGNSPEDEIQNPMSAKFNWKGMDEKSYRETVDSLIHNDKQRHDRIFGTLSRLETTSPNPELCDEAADLLLSTMLEAAELSVPIRKACSRSKAWWT